MSICDDILADYRNNKKKTIISMGRSSGENEMYCPLCGEREIDFWEHLPNEQEKEVEVDCGHCDGKYMAWWEYRVSTRELK